MVESFCPLCTGFTGIYFYTDQIYNQCGNDEQKKIIGLTVAIEKITGSQQQNPFQSLRENEGHAPGNAKENGEIRGCEYHGLG